MNDPTFDEHGYPTDETLERIEAWPLESWPGDAEALLAFAKKAFHETYGRWWVEDGRIKIATGGWSGNESVISALAKNLMFWATYWQKSERGGYCELESEVAPTPAQ